MTAFPLDPAPLPDLPRPWLGQRSHGDEPGSGDHVRDEAGPGQPDATVSFAVTGETQPFSKAAGDFGNFAAEMATLDDAEGIQP